MARITPINIIKGISGKLGKNADFYFATNSSSGKIRISRLPKPSHRPPTEKQREQRARFAARQAAVTDWLNANKPNELNGQKGTEAYQHVQQLKRKMGLSLINQVLLKYMDENNVIRLPETEKKRSWKPMKPYKRKSSCLDRFTAFAKTQSGSQPAGRIAKPSTASPPLTLRVFARRNDEAIQGLRFLSGSLHCVRDDAKRQSAYRASSLPDEVQSPAWLRPHSRFASLRGGTTKQSRGDVINPMLTLLFWIASLRS